jgi:hypothetical protein
MMAPHVYQQPQVGQKNKRILLANEENPCGRNKLGRSMQSPAETAYHGMSALGWLEDKSLFDSRRATCVTPWVLEGTLISEKQRWSLRAVREWLQGILFAVDIVLHNGFHPLMLVWVIVDMDHHRPVILPLHVSSHLQCAWCTAKTELYSIRMQRWSFVPNPIDGLQAMMGWVRLPIQQQARGFIRAYERGSWQGGRSSNSAKGRPYHFEEDLRVHEQQIIHHPAHDCWISVAWGTGEKDFLRHSKVVKHCCNWH